MKFIFSLVLVSLFLFSPDATQAQVGGEVGAENQFGNTLAVGDFNGDGINDLAVSTPYDGGDFGLWSGSVHIFLGTLTGLSDLESQTFTAGDSLGFNTQSGVQMGLGLASGDFNGDQFSDLAIGGPMNIDDGGVNAGAVVILAGSASGLQITGLPAIQNESVAGESGAVISSGDINGDQFDDIVVSSPNRGANGEVDVYFGSADGITTAGSQILVQNDVIGSAASFGSSSIVADFNNDAFDDVAIGIPNGSASSDPGMEGMIDIYYGSASGLDPAANVRFTQLGDAISGTGEAGDSFGFSLESGDFNMDGFADLVVGSPDENSGSTESSGAMNVILGSADGITDVNDFIVGQGNPSGISTTAAAGDKFGYSFASADFNNDGFADVAISAPGETDSDGESGLVHILFGDEGGFNTEADTVFSIADFSFPNEEYDIAGANFGRVMLASDFNGDTFADLVISSPNLSVQGATNAGAFFIVYGGADGLDLAGSEIWHQNSNPTSTSSEQTDLSDLFEISIYPNPFSNTLNLNIQGDAQGIDQFKVFDLMGREVFRSNPSTRNIIWKGVDETGSKLPNGSYIIELASKEGRYFSTVTLLR